MAISAMNGEVVSNTNPFLKCAINTLCSDQFLKLVFSSDAIWLLEERTWPYNLLYCVLLYIYIYVYYLGGFGSTLSPSPTSQTMGNPRLVPGSNINFPQSRIPLARAKSLPATPSSLCADYSGEHARITTLHGSARALKVNKQGGFTTFIANTGSKFASAMESSIDGIVRTTTSISNSNNGIGAMNEFGSSLNHHTGTGRTGKVVEHLDLGQNLGNKLIPSKHVGCVNGMHTSMLPMGNGNGIGNDC